jgi:hypothetical protein
MRRASSLSGRTAERAERWHRGICIGPCGRSHIRSSSFVTTSSRNAEAPTRRRAPLQVAACVCRDECAGVRALRIGGAWLCMRRRCGRTAGAQLLRVGVRGARLMSVQVDAAADGEPETAGRQGRNVHTPSVQLAADGRQALARRLGCDFRIAVRANHAVQRADERCAQRGPVLAVDMAAQYAVATTAGRRSTHGCTG